MCNTCEAREDLETSSVFRAVRESSFGVRFRVQLVFLASVFFLSSCGEQEASAEFSIRELGPFEDSLRELPLALWGRGEAK